MSMTEKPPYYCNFYLLVSHGLATNQTNVNSVIFL